MAWRTSDLKLGHDGLEVVNAAGEIDTYTVPRPNKLLIADQVS
jgi:hypothetical protein